jgi:hypothetical protein
VLPRIGGSHCDLAQALALAVFQHDRAGLGMASASCSNYYICPTVDQSF